MQTVFANGFCPDSPRRMRASLLLYLMSCRHIPRVPRQSSPARPATWSDAQNENIVSVFILLLSIRKWDGNGVPAGAMFSHGRLPKSFPPNALACWMDTCCWDSKSPPETASLGSRRWRFRCDGQQVFFLWENLYYWNRCCQQASAIQQV